MNLHGPKTHVRDRGIAFPPRSAFVWCTRGVRRAGRVSSGRSGETPLVDSSRGLFFFVVVVFVFF